jgi:phage host-nuclease inhibitor protein Gam
MNALEQYELEEIGNLAEEIEKQRFKVDSLESANWCLKKLAVLEKEQQEKEELAKKEIQRIEEWLKSEKERIANSKRFFECLLEEYFVAEKEKNPKFKISTPYGKVSSRKQQPKWVYDNEKAINSLKQAGLNDLIKIKEEIDKNKLKKSVTIVNGQAVTEDGEILEGITVEEQPEKIVIKAEVE